MKLDSFLSKHALWGALLFVGCASAHLQAASTLDAFFENNGSFELGPTTAPLTIATNSDGMAITGWILAPYGSTLQLLEDSAAQDGSRYVRLTSTGGGPAGSAFEHTDPVWNHQNYALVDYGGVNPIFEMDTEYELSFWAAGGVGTPNRLDFELLGANQHSSVYIPGYAQAEFDAMSEYPWRQYVIPFHTIGRGVPPEQWGPWDMTLYMGLNASTVVGENSSLYIDNFAITRVPEPSGLFLACAATSLSRRRRDRRLP
jgi:hypothetical protein